MTAAERMRRMRARRKADGFKVISSWVPSASGQQTSYSSHRLLEARSLAMHAVIAEKINRDPGLLAIAHRNLSRWSVRWPDGSPPWLQEWRQILLRPWPEIAALLTEPSENAARLRQSSPFPGVLTPAERKRIHEAFRT
ncbi:MAG: hypothetical protein ACLQFT_20310 [Steroidobacteraceae bacterium]|jgi:hypothetical protein